MYNCYKAKILLDSLNPYNNVRLTTFEITYPRIVHQELLTHRALSRNSASSRAIPNNKLREIIKKTGAYPVFWGKNQSGMAATEELQGWRLSLVKTGWEVFKQINLFGSWVLHKFGLHKQLANRLIEPWMPITVIVSATDFQNFFHLRCSTHAQPEIKRIAEMMRECYNNSIPHRLNEWECHLPFIENKDREDVNKFIFESKQTFTMDFFYQVLKKVSAGRCARVSYLTHDGKRDIKKDIELCNRLIKDGHWSPLEHVATPVETISYCGNFRGWIQFRKEFYNENVKG